MKHCLLIIACLLLLCACGGSGGSGSTAPTKSLTPTVSSATISGQIDLGGSLIEGGSDPTVEVDGVSATVTDTGGGVYLWNATVPANDLHDSYRVECFVNGNLVMAFDYNLDP